MMVKLGAIIALALMTCVLGSDFYEFNFMD